MLSNGHISKQRLQLSVQTDLLWSSSKTNVDFGKGLGSILKASFLFVQCPLWQPKKPGKWILDGHKPMESRLLARIAFSQYFYRDGPPNVSHTSEVPPPTPGQALRGERHGRWAMPRKPVLCWAAQGRELLATWPIFSLAVPGGRPWNRRLPPEMTGDGPKWACGMESRLFFFILRRKGAPGHWGDLDQGAGEPGYGLRRKLSAQST